MQSLRQHAKKPVLITVLCQRNHSTVTLLAKFLGWSTLHPLINAMW